LRVCRGTESDESTVGFRRAHGRALRREPLNHPLGIG
jgi:hypothetical protein